MRVIAAVVALLPVAVPTAGAVVTEPKTGVTLAASVGDMSLLGVGLRTKTFLRFKVYALGFYVADSALFGPLAVHKGRSARQPSTGISSSATSRSSSS